MASNIDFDQEKLKEAKRLGKFKSKKDTIDAAISEFIQRRKQLQVVELFGTIDFDKDYDYKEARKKR